MTTRTFSRGLMVIAGLLAGPGSADSDRPPAAPQLTRTDPRLERVERFFRRRGCPAQALAADFIAASDRHGLDWRLLPSLSFVESTGGKHAPNHNMFGWASARASFRSHREAIDTVASRLANAEHYRRKSLDRVLHTYNPRRGYAQAVKTVMQQLGPAELTPQVSY